jgi:hypothetical protein
MEFRLETDFYEQSEVMVAYRARKPDSPSASFYELDKLLGQAEKGCCP